MRSFLCEFPAVPRDSKSPGGADDRNVSVNSDAGDPTARTDRSLAHSDFSSVVELIKDYAVFLLDENGRVRSWNLGAQRIKGYQASEIVGEHFSRFYTAEDVKANLPAKALHTALQDGRYEKEGWRVRKDGTRFWADVVITPVRSASGELAGFVKVTRDLTERRLAQENLRQSRERSRLLVENLRDYAIFFVDLNGNVGTWNSGAEQMTGYRPDQIVGRHFSILYPPEEIKEGRPSRDLEIAVRDWRVEYEGWRLRKDGSRFQAEVAMWVLYNDRGTTVGFIISVKDVTERNKAQEERALRLGAESALRERDDFLSVASHELRSPLSALKLYVQTILEELKSGNLEHAMAKLPERLERVRKQADRVEALISRMITVSIVAAGHIKLEPQNMDLSALASAVITDMTEAAQRANCEVSLQTPGPVEGFWSREHIEEVIRSLLQNALKFGRAKPIQIEVGADETYAWLNVKDQGIGIEKADQERIFERFQRAVDTRNYGGFGLGLWISRQIVKLSGGEIGVHSTPGQGAVFTFSLPRFPVDGARGNAL
jgi:PAS domain S-box-containing protein